MTTAQNAVGTLSNVRQSAAALARAPKIPRRAAARPAVEKRAAIVLRRGMRPLEFRQIEEEMERRGLTTLPVLPGARKTTLAGTPVCGLIITGSDIDPSPMERDMIEDAVRTAIGRSVPVLALSDAAGIVLEAAGLQMTPQKQYDAVLLDGDVTELTSPRQVEDAIKAMAKRRAG